MAQGCQISTKSGKPCRAAPVHGKTYCFQHSPDEQAKFDARSKGGKVGFHKVLPAGFSYVLSTRRDVQRMLADVANKVLCGEIDHKLANTASYVAMTMLKAFAKENPEVGEGEEVDRETAENEAIEYVKENPEFAKRLMAALKEEKCECH